MQAEFWLPFFDWLSLHPALAGLIVFAVAMGESLLIVGLIVPGAVLMFGIGALIGGGVMDMWETMAWAFLGAVAGDGISFWIGRYYSDRLPGWWPFRRHPEWIARGESFFRRHGGKSILFGRFVGPVRPVIPAVAGMLGMRPLTFMVINVMSALAWSPAYLFPGIVFGTSLGLAKEVATRLAVLLLLLAAAILLVLWLVRRLYLYIQPRAASIITRLLDWSYSHPRIGNIAAAVVDPNHPEAKGLLILAVLLVFSTGLFLTLVANLAEPANQMLVADRAVYDLFQQLRTPSADSLMLFFLELGDPVVLGSLIAVVLAWFLVQKNWRAASHWLAATGFGLCATLAFKYTLDLPRPPAAPTEFIAASFPSWHAVMSTVTFGFIAVFLAERISLARRWRVYALAGIFTLPIAFSSLYLGSHWLSDVVGGVALGLVWITLVGIAYRRHMHRPVPTTKGLSAAVALALVIAGTWHVLAAHERDQRLYAVSYEVAALDMQAWWQRDWRTLPVYRTDLLGHIRQPLDIQLAGEFEALKNHLEKKGWRTPSPLTPATALYWLIPQPDLSKLPVLPNVFEGRHESLLMVRQETEREQLVLRLWPSDHALTPGTVPLWVGNVARQHLVQPLGLLAWQKTESDFRAPLRSLMNDVADMRHRLGQRAPARLEADERDWDGNVLLLVAPRR